MDNGRTRAGGWTRRALFAAVVAVAAGWMAGCGPAGEKEIRKGRAAEALGDYAEAKQWYAQAIAADNASGARFLAELLVAQDAAALFGTSADRDAQWVAQAEALTAQIAKLGRQAESNGTPVDGLQETLADHEKAIREAQEALERIAAERRAAEEARRQAEEAARLKAEAEARAAEEEARRIAAAQAAQRAKEEAAANAIRNLFLKAKKAEEDGLINFYGFYLGMPKEDAVALREHYGLDEKECKIEVVEHGAEMSSLNLSLLGLRRVTKGGNSFEELAQTVANRVGNLEWYNSSYWYTTIDEIKVRIQNDNGLEAFHMFGGKHVEKLAAQRKAEWWKKLEDDLKVEAMKIESMLGTGKEAGETKAIALGEGVEMEMVWCPPGTFMMGSPMEEIGRDRDETQHNVTLTKGFWLAKTEVTQKQWKSVMGNNPSINLGDDFPVEQVSWEDAQMFCLKAGLRLPTEAQWEYACRAGTERAYAGSRKLDEMGWKDGKVHFVGKKKPNAWGLYDMHGNVNEWCADWYGEYPSGAVTDPKGAASGRERVCRGGGYHSTEGHCRSAYRESFGPSSRFSDLGFRSASIPAAE